jgi:hypothetical protein
MVPVEARIINSDITDREPCESTIITPYELKGDVKEHFGGELAHQAHSALQLGENYEDRWKR